MEIYGIGGYGDYDDLFRRSMNMIIYPGLTSYFWSLINDFPVQCRLLMFFFRTFGYLNGINYYIYLIIVLSSFVCLLPFILFSKLNKFSLGGFIASLFLAINPLAIWVSSGGRTIDALTTFFFSIFILLFVIALNKRNYFLASLVGIFAFVDVINRGMEIFNDWPVLLFFALLFSLKKVSISKIFPFIKLKFKHIFYGFFPFIIFFIIYIFWNIYYFMIFKKMWGFSPLALLVVFNPVVDQIHVLGSASANPFMKIANYFLLLFTAISKMPGLYLSAYILVGFIILGFLALNIQKKYLMLKISKIVMCIILLYLIIYASMHFLINTHVININLLTSATRYFLDISYEGFILTAIFILYLVVQILLVGKKYFRYLSLIVAYILVLAYGLFVSFTDRHYIQVLVVFFILFGLSLDCLYKTIKTSKNIILIYLFITYILYLSINIIYVCGINLSKIGQIYTYYSKEKQYLISLDKKIPKNSILLLRGDKENPIFIASISKRDIIYNVNVSDAIYMPYNKKVFEIPYSNYVFPPYIVDIVGNGKLRFASLLHNSDEFKKHNVYVLDYDLQRWKNFLEGKTDQDFHIKGKFKLKKIEIPLEGRAVYKLELSTN